MNIAKKSLRELHPKRIDVPLSILLAAVLLSIGLSLPLMKVQQMVFWKSEYSVIQGVLELLKHGDYVLSLILFFFCVIFPIVKLLVLWILWEAKLTDEKRQQFLKWLALLGKWSMLDVFVVAIIIVLVKLGPLAKTEAQVGVYVFAAAILWSLISTMIVESVSVTKDNPKRSRKPMRNIFGEKGV